jgi:predicted HAD superfamily Cof-like phosphohydrolase|tara:strand:- start:2173 stop:2592 length:420 start_codon:yes stop_codon:yes gene_type:complete
MKKQLQQLWDFQSVYDQTRNTKPTLISPTESMLRYELGKEELIEYLEACNNDDIVEVTDALADQLYILLGTMVAHGMQGIIKDVFNEVHRSNMSKLGEDGKPIYREDGKVLKGPNYSPPNIGKFLDTDTQIELPFNEDV